MDIVYFVLFAAVGLFNLLAGALDFKWYVDYWVMRNPMKQSTKKRRRKWRVLLCIAGAVLIAFGAVFYTGII